MKRTRRVWRSTGWSRCLFSVFFLCLIDWRVESLPAPSASWKHSIRAGPVSREVARELPLLFEENRGQTLAEAKYLARAMDFVLLLTPESAIWALPGGTGKESGGNSKSVSPPDASAHLVRLEWVGISPEAILTAEEAVATLTSYFRGSDSAKWYRGVANHRSVRYHELYPGIDLVFYGKKGLVEYDFVLSPGADPGRIRLKFQGTKGIRIDAEGDLVLETPAGELRHSAPAVYQGEGAQRRQIDGRYELAENGTVTFQVDAFDRSRSLTIDPVLLFSTYLGGSADEELGAIAVDSEGSIYLLGSTGSVDFPLLNPFQEEFAGGGFTLGDVFVTKLDLSASSVVYSTYIGGRGTDIGRGLAVDSLGQAVGTGTTFSGDFPSTPGTFQPLCSGLCPFVFKLSADGSELVYSTFVGRGDGSSVALDASGLAVLTGRTSDSDFPVKNAFQPTRGGSHDAFVAKLNNTGTDLVFSTYLGGDDDENIIGKHDVATDPSGNIYVTGRTSSSDFPTQNPVQAGFQGVQDAFAAKFDGQGGLIYSTFLGGSGDDVGQGICADEQGNAYVTGYTESTDFPTENAFQPGFGGGIPFGDAFVTKIAPAGGSLIYSTYLGGEAGDTAADIAVDEKGQTVIVTGSVTVTFDIPLGGVIRFNLTPFGIAGVGAGELVRGFISPVRRSSVNTGIALFNTEDQQVSLTMRLRNRAGEEVQGGLRLLALPAGGHLAQFIDQLFPNADLTDFEGTLTVEVSTFNALIAATALELGSQPGDFTTLPVTPLP